MIVKLIDFDNDYFKTLKDKEIMIMMNEGKYYTITFDNKKVGVIGFIPSNDHNGSGDVQIIISPESRGKGLVKLSEDFLAKKHNIKTLYITLKKNNISAIKAHEKAGFNLLDNFRLTSLISTGAIKDDEIRLVKKYLY